MNTTSTSICIACGIVLLALVTTSDVRAQSSEAMEALQYPVAELGSCGSKEECKAYCDEPGNLESCLTFAEKNRLMPEKEIQMAKKFLAAGAKGPGGCTGKDSCEAYCNDTDHIDACVAFAEENGLMSGDELQEAKKVQAAVKRGVKPPACRGKEECDAYCESPDHMPECITFAKAAGLMSEEEQANAEKMLQAVQNGAKPPACRGKKECDAYCAKDENFDECVTFGKAAGFMSEDEYEMAKKTRGKGPGGCRGKEECDAFCNSSPENENICLNFQIENGILSKDDAKRMEEDGKQFRDSFSNMPPEVASCLSDAWGAENFEKLKAGTMRPSRWTGDAMSTCFGKFEQQRKENERPSGPPPGGDQQRYDGPRPSEGGFPPCEGEDCRPPEGFRPPEGQYGPPPEGSFSPPCEGENCRPPEGFRPPEGQQYGQPPEGFVPPSESAPPAPVEVVAPAPEPSPAPAPEPIPVLTEPVTITPEEFSAAVIFSLQSFGRLR